jgi:hypothetical protein
MRCCIESSSATAAAALHQHDYFRPVNSVRLPESQASVRTLLFHPVLNHVFWVHDPSVCLVTSMIELFMLDLVKFIIYLFRI